ncbi:transmembrane protein, putative [Medicago truncatula]|uniref:Transmembrane protein, putative n=1 Tax=Medicago truncatula TaxID=3880 RepID=A0A072TY67_MEDTR|nr:transmembrane protein, putative [Medicago truncatula]
MSAHRRRRRGFNNETLTTYRFSNNVVAGNIVVANAVVMNFLWRSRKIQYGKGE